MKKNTNSKSKAKKIIASGTVGVAAAAAGIALKESSEEVVDTDAQDESSEVIPEDISEALAEVQGSGEEIIAMASTEEQVVDLDGVVVTGHASTEEQDVAPQENLHVVDTPETPVHEEYVAEVVTEAAPVMQEEPLVAEAVPVQEESYVDDTVQILDDSAEVNDVAMVVDTDMDIPEPVSDAGFFDPEENAVSYMTDDADMAMADANDGFMDDVVEAIKDFGDSISNGISDMLSHDAGDGMVNDVPETDTSDYVNDANVDAFL